MFKILVNTRFEGMNIFIRIFITEEIFNSRSNSRFDFVIAIFIEKSVGIVTTSRSKGKKKG
uniref:Uncharacterized protein n=1 Tax=Borrelia miyamotoi TaxID=47466 RepID=A0A482CZB0_9SPIR|nr:hypothetical protein EZU71_06995 [Borrelia miyamotoi]